jgi:O-antigen/teichoic acid export membrane protein
MTSRLPWLGRIIAGDEKELSFFLIQGSVGILLLRITSTGLSFVTSIILARLLGANEYGVYAYSLAWVLLLVMLAVMGLDKLLVRNISAYKTRKEWGKIAGLIRRSNQAVCFTSCALILSAAFAAWLLIHPNNPTTLHSFWLALLLIPVLSFTRLRQSILQGLKKVILGLIPETVIQPILFLIFLGTMHIALNKLLSAQWAIAGFVFAYAVSLAVLSYLLKKALPPALQKIAFSYETRLWIRSTLPLFLIEGMAVISARADIIMLGALKPSEMAGIYNITYRGAELIAFVFNSVNMVLAPTIASLYATSEIDTLQRVITWTTRSVLLISLPVTIFFIFFGNFFLSLFGQEFMKGHMSLCILSIGQMINVAMGSVGFLLVMTGHERKAAIGIGIGAVFNVILNAFLIPKFGMEGAATATSISVIVWNLLLAHWVYRRLGIHTTALGKISFGKRHTEA